MFSPCLALGTPENAGVALLFRPLLGPREGRAEVAISDVLPALGIGASGECKGYVAMPPSFGPPRR